MKTKFTPLFVLLLFATGMTSLNAQTPFYSEDFSDSNIMSVWEDASDLPGNDCEWRRCANPNNTGSECPAIFSGNPNNQAPFNSTTATNGFLNFNSLECGLPHTALLYSEFIDCTGQDNVYLRFETHIGIGNSAAEGNAFVVVGTGFLPDTIQLNIFPSLSFFDRWSGNPVVYTADISSIAANKEYVVLQWHWTGDDEYHWSIDDLQLFNSPPPPVSNENLESDILKANIFPNPAKESINLDINLAQVSKNTEVKIMDINGKVMSMEQYENIQQTSLNYVVKEWQAGTYFMQIITDEGSTTKRFVVTR